MLVFVDFCRFVLVSVDFCSFVLVFVDFCSFFLLVFWREFVGLAYLRVLLGVSSWVFSFGLCMFC